MVEGLRRHYSYTVGFLIFKSHSSVLIIRVEEKWTLILTIAHYRID